MEKPILFSTEMVRAVLDGRKTQTRRVVKPAKRNHRGFKQGNGLWIDGYRAEDKPNGHIKDYSVSSVWQRKDYYIKDFAPYKPGDILWVRETFCEVPYEYNHIPIKGGHITIPKYAYKADSERDYTGIWKPSIHMPKEVARIWLEVTDVRVERLQEITEEDARAEGALPAREERGYNCCRDGFITLWDSLNAKRGYGWETNPWVWVVSFKRLD